MKNSSFRTSGTITILVVVIALNLAAAAAYLFLVKDFKSVVEEVIQNKEKISVYEADIRALSRTEKVLAETVVERGKLDKLFISPDGVVDFIQSVESLAEAVNLSIETKGVSVAEAGKNEKFETLQLELTTEGSWSNTATFLGLLEALPYGSSVAKVQFVNETPEEKSRVWKTGFLLKALKMK